jgi:hypothetical protein
MTKRLEPVPAQAYPAAHTLFRALFFGAVLLVGGTILGVIGLRLDHVFMKWLHL